MEGHEPEQIVLVAAFGRDLIESELVSSSRYRKVARPQATLASVVRTTWSSTISNSPVQATLSGPPSADTSRIQRPASSLKVSSAPWLTPRPRQNVSNRAASSPMADPTESSCVRLTCPFGTRPLESAGPPGPPRFGSTAVSVELGTYRRRPGLSRPRFNSRAYTPRELH